MGESVRASAARVLRSVAVLTASALLAPGALAQAPPSGVFSEVQSVLVPGPGEALDPAIVRSRMVQLDTRKITAARRGREVLKLNLFDDEVVEVRIRRIRPTRTGYFISGTPRGKEWGEVRLVVNGPVMVGTVETPEGKFTIRSAGSGRHVIRQIDPSKESLECEVQADPAVNSAGPARPPAISSRDPSAGGGLSSLPVPRAEVPTEDGSEVRILVVYTPALQRKQGGAAGMRALVDFFVESANQAFEDSGINPRLVLAHSAMVNRIETGSDLIPLITSDDGHMDEVHSLRNEHAADLVHLLTDKAVGPAGSAVRPPSESLIYAESAGFAVTANASEETFTHEIGHNFGLKHDRYVSSVGNAIYPYAFGYINDRAFQPDAPRSARWRTVMAYSNPCGRAGFGCPRLLRFSNPDQTHLGDVMGVPADSPVTGSKGPADARLAINNSARWVGSFRSEACTEFSVSQETRLAPLAGGEIAVKVDTSIGCVWGASSEAEFMKVVSDKRQSGSGFVNLEVDANRTGAERTGVLTVAGKRITVRQLAKSGGVCGRSPAVMQAITAAAGLGDPAQCDQVTEDRLALIRQLDISRQGLAVLKEGDFAGLSGLTQLNAYRNQLTELPAGLFDGLSSLEAILFQENELTELPGDLFTGLSKLKSLHLERNRLAELPASLFSDLSNLKHLNLYGNRITRLPDGLFAGLAALESLNLEYNAITELPAGLLDGLSNLEAIDFRANQLTQLSGTVFAGLTRMERLDFRHNRLEGVPTGLFAGLSNLRELNLTGNRISELPPGIFSGLSNLQRLTLDFNRLTGLPGGLLSGLSALSDLQLQANRITRFGDDSFAGLSSLRILRLDFNRMTALPEGMFSDLSMLEELNLSANEIAELPPGSFAGLTKLQRLLLANNRLRNLPPDIFSDLRTLRHLNLWSNDLVEAPKGIFSGLTSLDAVHLGRNRVDPLPLQLSVEQVGESRLKVVVPSAAPFDLQLPVSITGGTIEDGAGSVNIPIGTDESGPLGVVREPDSGEPVAVDIGALPNMPSGHSGYALAKSDSLPLRILPSNLPTDARLMDISLSAGELNPVFFSGNKKYEVLLANELSELTVDAVLSNARASLAFLDAQDVALEDADKAADGHQINLFTGRNTIRLKVMSEDGTRAETYELVVTRDGPANGCVRSSSVREAILAAISEVDACSDLTPEHLSSILKLDLSGQQISTLTQRDFAGLDSLQELNLNNNALTALPTGIFSDLQKLRILRLVLNELSSLPEGVFSGLTSLNQLWIGRNRLAELPSGLFYGLTALQYLGLPDNRLASLRVNEFSGLAALKTLHLYKNRLIDLPAGVFSDLTNLEELGLWENSLLALRADMFYGLTGLRDLYLSENDVTEIPPGLFDGLPDLEVLSLGGNQFASLPEGIFAGLRNLRSLGLYDNELSHIPAGLFAGLHALESLNLWDNGISNLPADVFSGLTSLRRLFLNGNRLSVLPPGVFSGLTALEKLDLRFNSLTRLPITISLEESGESQFRATAHTAAPFDLHLPVHISDSGQLEDGTSTVTIPIGELASMPVAVTRLAGSEEAVIVNVGILPDLPEQHEGYGLEKDDTLPRTILPGPGASSPVQVTGVEVDAGAERLEVSWVAVADADGYKVQWKSDEEGYDDTRQEVIIGGDTATHTITGLTAGAEYTVRVIATKQNADDGPPSTEITGVPGAESPAQVSGVAIAVGVDSLDVSWNPVANASGYKVEWKSGSEDYDESRKAVLIGGDTVSYTITKLTAGTAYTVRVIATREHADDGVPSEEVAATPRVMSPDQVMGVALVAGVEQLAVSWEAVSDADGYKVQWTSGGEDYDGSRQAVLSRVDADSYTITGLTAGTEYRVRVIAVLENADDGLPSSEVAGVPNGVAPAQVTGVAVEAGIEELQVSWDTVSDADGYKVQWKSGGEDYDSSRQSVLSGGDADSYAITGLTAGAEYTVRVIATRAHADDGLSSEEVKAAPQTHPPAQVTGVAVAPGHEELQVSWDAVSDADGYKVQWKSGGEDYAEERQVALLGGETTGYTIIDLTLGTEYTIRVIATKEHADDGAPSEEVTATPARADPDVNGDGTLDGDDAQVMYQAYASAGRVGDGESGGTAALRRTLLSGLAGTDDPTDDDLKAMLRKANVWRSVGLSFGGDINEDGAIDGDDAFVMYYAYEFADLVGDGETGGTARHRQFLLSPRAGKDDPSDADLKKMLRRANQLKEDFG